MSVSDFLSQHGLIVSEIILDNKIHRVPLRDKPNKKDGWYTGWQLPNKVCIAGDWRKGDKHVYIEGKKKRLSREEMKQVNMQIAEKRAADAEERRKAQVEAAVNARSMWDKATPNCAHTYLEKKQVENYGLRKLDSMLLVPMTDTRGELFGLQRIYDDGGKFFLKGQRTRDLFYKIPGDDSVTYFCEGYATGATIHEITGMTTVIAFNAGNLKRLGKIASEIAKGLEIVFCGDNDAKTEGNPGLTAAAEAAKAAHAQYCYPVFKDPDTGTDFNDLAVAEGEEAVLRCLGELLGKPKTYQPVGTAGSGAYFYNFKTLDVFKFSSWSQSEFFHLATLEEWRDLYPKDDDNGDGVDWARVKSDLIQAGLNVGPFDPFKVRGTGVWLDDGRVIVNTGTSLYQDRHIVPHQDLKSKYVYVRDKRQIPAPHNPATPTDLAHLVSALNLMRWQKPAQKFYFGGWLAISRIAGALPIRPHLWLTGASGSGKSTLLERIVSPLIGAHSEYVLGATTEAGLRQTLQYASVPIIFDEFESNNPKEQERVSNVVALLRNGWSPTTGKVIKGSATGIAQAYAVQSPALVSSIRTNLDEEADQSRFTICELIKADQTQQWESLKACLEHVTPELGDRLFARTVSMIETIARSYDVAQAFLKTEGISARLASQYGMLLAGWHSLIQDAPLTVAQLNAMLADIKLESADRQTDQEMCFDWLMCHKVRLNRMAGVGPPFIELEVGEYWRKVADGEAFNDFELLTSRGLLVENKRLIVSNNHSYLKTHVFKDRWFDWKQTLKRLPGAEPTKDKKFFAGSRSRGVVLTLDLFRDT